MGIDTTDENEDLMSKYKKELEKTRNKAKIKKIISAPASDEYENLYLDQFYYY